MHCKKKERAHPLWTHRSRHLSLRLTLRFYCYPLPCREKHRTNWLTFTAFTCSTVDSHRQSLVVGHLVQFYFSKWGREGSYSVLNVKCWFDLVCVRIFRQVYIYMLAIWFFLSDRILHQYDWCQSLDPFNEPGLIGRSGVGWSFWRKFLIPIDWAGLKRKEEMKRQASNEQIRKRGSAGFLHCKKKERQTERAHTLTTYEGAETCDVWDIMSPAEISCT